MTSLNQINTCISRLDAWRKRREAKGLDIRTIKKAVHLLCEYRNLIKEETDARKES